MQTWAHENTTAVLTGHRLFHLHSYIWEPTARTTGAKALKSASGCCCWSLLLPMVARVLYGLPFPCHQPPPWSLVDKVWVMHRICIKAVRGASHTGRLALTHQMEELSKQRAGGGQPKRMKNIYYFALWALQTHYEFNLNSWYFSPKLLVFA